MITLKTFELVLPKMAYNYILGGMAKKIWGPFSLLSAIFVHIVDEFGFVLLTLNWRKKRSLKQMYSRTSIQSVLFPPASSSEIMDRFHIGIFSVA